ncbi:MAG: alpha/beta hydrolase [Fidelibacterota bacterium]|nr:MAG: alpha/beta hydrolase [Candidatus Neomarinimicrobiota bacterium]
MKRNFLLGLAILAITVPCISCSAGVVALPTREMQTVGDGVSLHLRIAGDPASGEVLIALHGGPGMNRAYMLNLEQLANQELAVVTYDQRGSGLSTSPAAEPANYTLAKHVADLEVVRKTLGVEQVHFLGHSWGGILALQYALVHPQRVQSLILVNSGPPTWEGIMEAQASLGARIQALQQAGVLQTGQPQSAGEALKMVLPAYFSDPSFWFSSENEKEPVSFSQTANSLTMVAIEGYDITSELARLDHRVLILRGEDDPFGRPMIEATRSALKNARVEMVELERCGHFWHECPDEFFARVRAFLD